MCKYSYYHNRVGFGNFSEIFSVWIPQRTQTFHGMFWEVFYKIYWHILLPVKILQTLYKMLQKLFSKSFSKYSYPRNNFLNQYFYNLAQTFSVRLQEMLRKRPIIITGNVSETFLKYFVNGLDRHKHFTKFFGKFVATFIEIFHASFLLR